MPSTLSLAAYAVKVWNYEERDSETISDFGDGEDLLDVFSEMLSQLKAKASHDKANKQVVVVDTLLKDVRLRTLRGIIWTGDYGSESNLWDIETQRLVYKKKTNEANMLPFYFLLDLPEGTDEGILVLQRTGM